MYDGELFKAELIQIYGNRLSKEDAQRERRDLRHNHTINKYLNTILSLSRDAQIGSSFLRTTITNNVRRSRQQRIVDALQQPTDWQDWRKWVKDIGRVDQKANRRINDTGLQETTQHRKDRHPPKTTVRQRPPNFTNPPSTT